MLTVKSKPLRKVNTRLWSWSEGFSICGRLNVKICFQNQPNSVTAVVWKTKLASVLSAVSQACGFLVRTVSLSVYFIVSLWRQQVCEY